VDPNAEPAADWRDEALYAPLLGADRSIFAWEWLRRDHFYREAAVCALRGVQRPDDARPERWGLVRFEDPGRSAPIARPIWRSDAHPPVLAVSASTTFDLTNGFALGRFAPIATLASSAGTRQHLLLSEGLNTIRVDVLDGTLGAGPVELRYHLAGTASVERPLLTLRRLLALQQTGRFSRSLHPPEAKAGADAAYA
jgi:hypothetical protein